MSLADEREKRGLRNLSRFQKEKDMEIEMCIFVDTPRECRGRVCLRSLKLHCLLNKQHLIVRQESKAELSEILTKKINHPDRYKTKSGEVGRK